MEQYIILADKYKFGSQKIKYHVAINYSFNKTNKHCILFIKIWNGQLKYQMKIANTKDKMNKRLIDSFSVAFVRDQEQNVKITRLWLRMILKCQTFTMDF
jgi:hypothetical protein